MSPWSAEFLLWDAWALTWVAAALWASRAARRAPPLDQWPHLAVALAGLVFLNYQGPASPLVLFRLWNTPLPLAWALVGVSFAGFALCWWARLALGRLWSGTVTRKADHRVVESGPYRLVRHPIYTGILLAALALAIMDGTAGAFVGLSLMTLGLAWKARIEETFLTRELGAEAYEAYAARTPMLLPLPAAIRRWIHP